MVRNRFSMSGITRTEVPRPLESNGIVEDDIVVGLPGHPYKKRVRVEGYGLSVLSFDGGGYRGYASLLILQNILRLAQPTGRIFPYLYFDYICGTSTGGLIAILLAVLHLDIETAIEVYKQLGRTIFANTWRKTRWWLQDAQFNHKLLRTAISDILRDYGGSRTLMHEFQYDRGCRCFVTTKHCARPRNSVMLVRSYGHTEQSIPDGYNWTIMDAALATSAAPTYFKRHHIMRGHERFEFEDAGAHGKNNPSELAVEECDRIDLSGYSLFLSIGTGVKATVVTETHKTPGKFRRTFRNLVNPAHRVAALARGFGTHATDVTEVEGRMKGKKEEHPSFPYFRFNPPDLGNIDLADYNAIPQMEDMVAGYIKGNQDLFQDCGGVIKQIRRRTETWELQRTLFTPFVEVFRRWFR